MCDVTSKRLARFFLFLALLSGTVISHAQYYILGRVLDDDEVPYAYAQASLRGEDYSSEQTCTDRGVFRFENLKAGDYELVLVTPYGIRRRQVDLRGSIDITLHVPRNIQMDEISVVANKAGSREPVSHDNLTATEIRQSDFGKDLPFILEQTPSVVATSDAGNGIGYTGLRIRGTDPTRINVTLNGIPVNDAESQTVFWVDLPDLASSATNIQVQRGIGWSQPGTGDFGGSVNINTLGFHYKPFVQITFGGGSFNTQRTSITGSTGLLRGRFTLDERISFFSSDGYIDRASSKLNAVSLTGGYHHDATNIRLLFAYGKELTYQAWNGVPEQYIDDPGLRTYNSAGTERAGDPYDNQVDDYKQTNVQLHIDQAVTPFARWTTALHYTKGKGFYEEYKAQQALGDYALSGYTVPSDLIRQRWLDNDFYGFTSVLHFGKPEQRYFILGGGFNRYLGDHYGLVTWIAADTARRDFPTYYADDAHKKDGNLYGRSNMRIGQSLGITLDLQVRWLRYRFTGPDLSGTLASQEVHHRFFNPKLGLQYTLSDHASLYALTGIIHKEPNRDDYVDSSPGSRPEAEQLWDSELGLRFQPKGWNLEVNGYGMTYKDQLVPTGRLNDVGAYTRVNVPESYRIGVEMNTSLQLTTRLDLRLMAAFSDSRLKEFDEYVDDWDTGQQQVIIHQHTRIAFSPQIMGRLAAGYTVISKPRQELKITLSGRHVGKQYVDNTSNEASVLEAYAVADASLRWSFFTRPFSELTLSVGVYNVFDAAYSSNGWIYRFHSAGYDPRPDDPYAGLETDNVYHQKGYFPQAGRNLMVQFSARF